MCVCKSINPYITSDASKLAHQCMYMYMYTCIYPYEDVYKYIHTYIVVYTHTYILPRMLLCANV